VRPAGRWPRGVAPLRVHVDCAGAADHAITWRRGALVLEDHDAAADEVLLALGGPSSPCLDVLQSWRLGYIEEEPPTESAALVRSLSSLARWMSGGGSPAVLPEPLRRLREASVLHTWGRGLREPVASEEAQRDFLQRAIRRRLRDLVLRQLRPLGAERHADVEVQVDDGLEVRASGRCEGTRARVALAVPTSWLTDVWVPGLETWRGDVVLAVADRRPSALDVIRWWRDVDVDEAPAYELVVVTVPGTAEV
jgi:hypothetical protein